jgi:two-component system sensor histidine kinase ChiS
MNKIFFVPLLLVKPIIFFVIVVVITTFSFPSQAQERKHRSVNIKPFEFKHLSSPEGLSQNTVYTIFQDSKGLMWFGTQDGLNKYDGYEFTVYRHDPQIADSLSNNEIFAIFEDSQSTLWIGTAKGLNRFDRQHEQFIHYFHEPNNPYSLSHDEIWSIYEDNQGNLWIGTHGGGLNRFDRQQKQFIHYQHNPDDPNSLSSNDVWPIYQDHNGTLWIGTYNKGLNKFDAQHNHFIHYSFKVEDPDPGNDYITSLYQDEAGWLWISSAGGGIHKLNPQTEQIIHYSYDPNDPNSLSDNIVTTIKGDENGKIWIATDGGGLNLWQPQSENKFLHYKNNSKKTNSLNNNALLSLYHDRAGTLWIGTGGGGVNFTNPQLRNFTHYAQEIDNSNSLSSNHVTSLHADKDGFLWVATRSGGLNRFDPQRQQVTHYMMEPENESSLSHNDLQTLYQDKKGILWIGTYGGGLNRFNPKTQQFTAYRHDPNQPTSLSDDYILSIYEDSNNTLWVGTMENGLEQFDRQTGKFIHFTHDSQNPQSLSDNTILCIYEDSNQTLWIGTLDGLNKKNQSNHGQPTFTRYQHQPNDPTSLSDNEISAIYESSRGQLWIGTAGGGLNLLDRQTSTFIHYRELDGLPNDTIYGILEDEQDYLWLSTNKGLSRFNPLNKTFKNYDVSDGLQSLEFNGAYAKSPQGELFFGGINGFNAFFPAQVKDNTYIPPVVMTDFEIFNKSVTIGKNSPLQQHISETTAITLSYKQTFFSFQFAALNFILPNKNQYAYKLEDFDNDWNYIGNRRNAYYTNVPYGEYTFRVKASNNDAVWNEQGNTIHITILPPPWRTWWAYLLYALTLIAIVTRYLWVQQKKLLDKQRELEKERQIAAQLKEADRLKDEFLANTSHELRTPLNGIIGIADSLIDGATGTLSQSTNNNLAMIVSSARRLLNLVNDILDFSKIKQKEIALQKKAVDMQTIAELVLTLTRPLIGNKPVQLNNAIPTELPPSNADESRVQQILYNLVGNAIKFTDRGTITLSAQLIHCPKNGDEQNDNAPQQWLAITVSDTGIGIPAKKLDRIFEAFEQADGSTSRIYGGTGLGLAVTQQLVRLHGGQLTVQSEIGKGSNFTFTLPLHISLTNSQAETTSVPLPLFQVQDVSPPSLVTQVSSNENIKSETQANIAQPNSNVESDNKQSSALPTKEYTIFIVDDDPINRQVLINHLSLQNYQITQATSGVEAMEVIANGFKPDLILLDVMMPHMTGYEVTQKIREQWQANELPILLLTAKNQMTDLVTGLEIGANDYLTKPIAKEELLARIKTHLHIQQLRAENLRMSAELAITQRLQQMLLPTEEELQQVSGLAITGFMAPADEVGGDYYDVLQYNGRTLLTIGDATGHGLESGVMMVMVQTAVRTLLESEERDPARFLNILNRTIYKNVQERIKIDKNLSLALLEYQFIDSPTSPNIPMTNQIDDTMTSPTAQGILKISGQHEEIIIVKKSGELKTINTQSLGFMIGFMDDISGMIDQIQISLNTGDLVVLYTDGLTEAQNAAGEYYGIDRLCETIKTHVAETVEDIRQAIIEDVQQYVGHIKMVDDITLLIFRQQ